MHQREKTLLSLQRVAHEGGATYQSGRPYNPAHVWYVGRGVTPVLPWVRCSSEDARITRSVARASVKRDARRLSTELVEAE